MVTNVDWKKLAQEHQVRSPRAMSFYRNTFEHNHDKYHYSDPTCPARATVAPYGLIEGLTETPFFDLEFFPFCKSINHLFDELIQEGKQLINEPKELYSCEFGYSQKIEDSSSDLAKFVENRTMYASVDQLKKHTWWPLLYSGKWAPVEYLQRTPAAWQIAQQIVKACPYTLEIVFLQHEPNATIGPHVDLHNGFVTFYFVVECAEQGVVLEVDGIRKDLVPGMVFGFDNTYRHAAWNHAASPRLVFSAIIRHPLLSLAEKRELIKLENFLGGIG